MPSWVVCAASAMQHTRVCVWGVVAEANPLPNAPVTSPSGDTLRRTDSRSQHT